MTDDLKITWLTLSLIDLLVVETWRREAEELRVMSEK